MGCSQLLGTVVEGWLGRAPPHFIAHTCIATPELFSLFSFVKLHISMEGCYRRVLIWGILVSRHIVGASRTLSKSGRRPFFFFFDGGKRCRVLSHAGDRAAATDSTLSRTRSRTELRVKIARASPPAILLLSTSSTFAARSRRERSDGSSLQHQGHRRQWELLGTPLQSPDSAA